MTWKNITGLWRPRAAVGLSLGAASIRAVRVERTDNGLQVNGRVEIDLPLDRPPHPAEVETALRKVAGDLLREKTRLLVNLRAQDAGLHLIKLPFDRPDKVRRVLRYEAEPHFLTAVEDLVLDYLPLPVPDRNDRPGVVFGARPDVVTTLVNDLDQAGLSPDAVLPDRLGLLVAAQRLVAVRVDQSPLLLLDLGASQTGLVMMDEQGRPLVTRSLFYGGRDITRTLAEALRLDIFEAERLKRETSLAGGPAGTDAPGVLAKAWSPLILEIQRTLAAGAGGAPDTPPPVVILSGGGARTLGLDDFLRNRLGLRVAFLEDAMADDPMIADLGREFAAPFGLAWLGLASGYQPNLRQGELARRAALAPYRKSLALLAVGLALVLILNAADFFYGYRLEHQRYTAVKAQLEDVYRKAVPGATRIVAPVEQMKQALAQAEGSVAGFNPARGRVLDLFLEVSKVAGAHEGVRITDLNLTPQTLDLQGEGGSFDVIDRLKNQLAALPFFSEAALGGARMDPVTRVLTFKISLKRKSG